MQVISALQTGPFTYFQRTAVTARSGEEAVLEWVLAKHAQRWCVASARRDPALDYPLPQEPHPRCAPTLCRWAEAADAHSSSHGPAAVARCCCRRVVQSLLSGASTLLNPVGTGAECTSPKVGPGQCERPLAIIEGGLLALQVLT